MTTAAALVERLRTEFDATVIEPPPCPYPAHRPSDWIGDRGKVTCGTCHPRCAGSSAPAAPARNGSAPDLPAEPPSRAEQVDPGPGEAPPPEEPTAPATEDGAPTLNVPPHPPEWTALAWRWADEVVTSTPPEPEWVWHGYLPEQAKVILAGLSKVGKTTLLEALLGAIGSGAPLFGRDVAKGKVVLASEEGDASIASKLAGLPSQTVRMVNRDSAWPKPPWPTLIGSATAEALRVGAKTLLIDSLAFWASFQGDAENNSGAAQAVVDALDEACRAGLAVLVVHHQVKSPGRDHGTGLRGSGAIAAAFDVIVEYERLGEDAPANQRRLVSLSRFPATPDVLVVDYRREDGTWRVVGEAEDRSGSARVGARERLLRSVPREPGATEQELADLLDLDRRKVAGPLRDLLDDSVVVRTGAGKKGDPYRYSRRVS